MNMWQHDRTRKIVSNTIGYLCIFIFFSVTSYTVYIFYSIIAPAILDDGAYGKFLFHFIFGNWLLINIYFNYIMACFTSPGLSKNYQNISVKYPVCRKCSFNKPPRAHHCSWCNSCVLRYDHHSPWFNNCVGFYNHRYFYQFCCFMCIGCFYAGWFGFREYQISLLHVELYRHIDAFVMAPEILSTLGVVGFITYYLFMVALGMGFLLLGLIWHHGRMISRDMTIIEYLTNQKDTQHDCEEGLSEDVTYNTNWVQNWKRFLGVRNIREFIRRVLLPSTHKPKGNGIALDDHSTNMNFKMYRKNSDAIKPQSHTTILKGPVISKNESDYLLWPGESLPNTLSPPYRAPTPSKEWKNSFKLSGV